MDNVAAWRLANFAACIDAWEERDQPEGDLALVVAHWIFSRIEDPYQGVRREPSFPNLWYGTVPNSEHGFMRAVLCCYWIYEGQRAVRCESIATLGLPH